MIDQESIRLLLKLLPYRMERVRKELCILRRELCSMLHLTFGIIKSFNLGHFSGCAVVYKYLLSLNLYKENRPYLWYKGQWILTNTSHMSTSTLNIQKSFIALRHFLIRPFWRQLSSPFQPWTKKLIYYFPV